MIFSTIPKFEKPCPTLLAGWSREFAGTYQFSRLLGFWSWWGANFYGSLASCGNCFCPPPQGYFLQLLDLYLG